MLAVTLGACALPPQPLPGPLQQLRPVVLLGEVHDNAAQHALRLRAFEALLAGGARPVLALEQFDRALQPAVDRLLAQTPRPDADAVIAAGGGSGWNWAFYRPFVTLALQHGLAIVGANVSRDEARAVMRQGLTATGFDARVPDDVLKAIASDIEGNHCGAIDNATARRMALAQVARDQFMARIAEAHADRGVLLLAGNGHVRTDLGVPRWLSPATRQRSLAIGLLEPGDRSDTFDRHVFTAAQQRPDPCAAFAAKAATPAAPAASR